MAKPTLVHARPGTLAHMLTTDDFGTVIAVPVKVGHTQFIRATNSPFTTVQVTATRGENVAGDIYQVPSREIVSRTPTRTTLIPVWREEV